VDLHPVDDPLQRLAVVGADRDPRVRLVVVLAAESSQSTL
jgi:hypothetical protein